jgi:hypothetical protein
MRPVIAIPLLLDFNPITPKTTPIGATIKKNNETIPKINAIVAFDES